MLPLSKIIKTISLIATMNTHSKALFGTIIATLMSAELLLADGVLSHWR